MLARANSRTSSRSLRDGFNDWLASESVILRLPGRAVRAQQPDLCDGPTWRTANYTSIEIDDDSFLSPFLMILKSCQTHRPSRNAFGIRIIVEFDSVLRSYTLRTCRHGLRSAQSDRLCLLGAYVGSGGGVKDNDLGSLASYGTRQACHIL